MTRADGTLAERMENRATTLARLVLLDQLLDKTEDMDAAAIRALLRGMKSELIDGIDNKQS